MAGQENATSGGGAAMRRDLRGRVGDGLCSFHTEIVLWSVRREQEGKPDRKGREDERTGTGRKASLPKGGDGGGLHGDSQSGDGTGDIRLEDEYPGGLHYRGLV